MDVATSPTIVSSKNRRSLKFHARRDTLVRLPSSRTRTRTFSVASLQSYLYFFWPFDEEDEVFGEEDEVFEDLEEDTLEPGCCNACCDRDVPWLECKSTSDSDNFTNFKFQLFAGVFCLLGAATFSLHQVK